MMGIGRVVLKTAGRDGGKKGVVIDIIDASTVLIDGETRRKKVSIRHLEPLSQTVEVKKGADTKTVLAALKAAGIDITIVEKKKFPKKPKAAAAAAPAKK